MYVTDVVWWGYTLAVIILAVFMLVFVAKVREKGD